MEADGSTSPHRVSIVLESPREVEAFVRWLRLPPVLTIEDLIAFTEKYIGRAISLRKNTQQPVPGEPCGLMARIHGREPILLSYYEHPTSNRFRDQCLLHEIAHLLLRHPFRRLTEEEVRRFCPDIRGPIHGLLRELETAEERTAERVADLLWRLISRSSAASLGGWGAVI